MATNYIVFLFTAIVSSALPLTALIVLRVKTKTGLLSAAVGAVGFILFALVLESILHTLVVPQILDKPWLYVVYGSLAAGVFEETSRLLGFKLLSKKLNKSSLKDAIGYGIGHGGIEAFVIVGIPYLITLSATFVKNGELLLANLPTELVLVAGIERLLAMSLHIALSLLVWQAATSSNKTWLYPTAILLHALANFGAGMAQIGIIGNNFVLIYSGLVVAIIVALGLFVRAYKCTTKTQEGAIVFE